MNPSDTTTFEIEQQSGQSISNIGGDQTIYYGGRSGAARLGKILGTVGLFLSIGGVAVLVPVVVATVHNLLHDVHAGGIKPPVAHYLPAVWPAAIGLLLGGFIVKRAARIVVGR
jgi:hypothetical protein